MLTKPVSSVHAVLPLPMGSMPPVSVQPHVQATVTAKILNLFVAQTGNTTGINASLTEKLAAYAGILRPDFLANVVRFNFVKYTPT